MFAQNNLLSVAVAVKVAMRLNLRQVVHLSAKQFPILVRHSVETCCPSSACLEGCHKELVCLAREALMYLVRICAATQAAWALPEHDAVIGNAGAWLCCVTW